MSRTHPRWRLRVESPGNARLVVAGDGVIVTSFGPGRSDALTCLAVADGEQRWSVPLPRFILADAMAGAELAADPDGDAVYLFQDGEVAAFEAATGDQRWAASVPAAPPFESFTLGRPPAVAGHRLYALSRQSRVVALDRRDGRVLFRTADRDPADDVAVHGPVVITRSREAHDVRGHDAATGEPRWRHALRSPFPASERLLTSIALAARRADDGLYLVADGQHALVALASESGEVRWQLPISGLVSYAFAGTRLVVADAAGARGVEPASGEVRWHHAVAGPTLVAPLDGTRVLLVGGGDVVSLAATGGEAEEHARHELDVHDRVLDARAGSVVLTTDNGVARLYQRAAGGLTETTVGETRPRAGNPFAHAVRVAALTADGVVTLDTAHEVARFAR